MELMEKKGLKQTEVGLIPKDWNVKLLGDIGAPKMCKRIFNYQTKKRGDIPFYKIGTFGKKPDAFIARGLYEEYKRKYSFPLNGSVLISAAGTIGRLVVYAGEDEYFQDSNIVWIENDEKLVTNHFLKHVFPSVNFKTEGSTISRLYNNILKSGEFACPGISEQKAIATSLRDVDELITNLDKLIAKKKDIKKGAMQQLLTPPQKRGKRLPGFTGDWEEKTLGDIVSFIKGRGLSKGMVKQGGTYPCILYGELFTTYNEVISEIKSSTDDFVGVQSIRGDILMPGSTTTTGIDLAVASCVQEDDILLGGDINILRPRKQALVDSKFLSYLITNTLKHKIIEHTRGITIIHLYGSSLTDVSIFYPSLKEQENIVEMFLDMDEEINLLQFKMKKYSSIKKGMMQELLTGKTRLI